MSIRTIVWSFFFLLTLSFKPAVAMHGKVLRAVQMTTGGLFIGQGVYALYNNKKEEKKISCYEPMPAIIQEWARKEMDQMKVPNASSILLKQGDTGSPWAVVNNQIIVSDNDSKNLEQALKGSSDNSDAVIATSAIILKHEIKHYIYEDGEKRLQALIVIPSVIQVGSFQLVSAVNKWFKVQPPTTVPRTIVRSFASVIGFIPKLAICNISFILWARHQETEADRFACEHAASRLELESFYQFFQGFQNEFEKDVLFKDPGLVKSSVTERETKIKLHHLGVDPLHPYYEDRKDMVLGYLSKWDEENKH